MTSTHDRVDGACAAHRFGACRPLRTMDAAKKWIDSEFQPSTLSKDEQMKEMQWFVNAAKPFEGMEINVVSETITTHEYESKCWPRPSPRSPASRSSTT